MADAHPSELLGLLNAPDAAAREAAWDRFAVHHSRLLLHTARSVARDHDVAMDAYTHVLEQLRADDFHRLRTFAADGRSKFTTWLVVVARRLCLDHYRARYGRPSDRGGSKSSDGDRSIRRRLVDLLAEQIDPAILIVSPEADPQTALEARQLSEAITAAVLALEPRDRLLLKLRFEDDLPAREIAAAMGFPTPFHVYRRLSTLFETLRELLRQRGVERPGT
jgi:RNA polymerase sigma factor (sigma-70 family)